MKELRFSFGLVAVLCSLSVANGAQTAFRVGGPFGDSEKAFLEGSSPTAFVYEGLIVDSGTHPTAITLQIYNESLTETQTFFDYCYTYDEYSDEYNTYLDSQWLHICGGNLISNNTVVTSATCVKDFVDMVGGDDLVMRAGVGWFELLEGVNGTNHQTYSVVDITVHPNFNSATPQVNNIAVVRLSQNVILNEYVKIAEMATGNSSHVNENCKFQGWGSTKCEVDGHRPHASLLQVANLTVMENGICNRIWGLKNKSILDTEVCGVNSVEHSTLCDGDFGGGLMCPIEVDSPTFELMGVASWNDAACNGCMPAVFERVSEFRAWLVNQIAEFGSS